VPIAWQVRDFLQRVKCGRFPPIEKDMKMVAAHCGSLFLDPAALSQVPAACTLCR
jgi:type III protein arginine methyltransferase